MKTTKNQMIEDLKAETRGSKKQGKKSTFERMNKGPVAPPKRVMNSRRRELREKAERGDYKW